MFSGGGAMSNTWPQILADILERPVHQMSDPRKVNTRGIGLLGFVHLGQLSLEELAKLCSVNQVFEPRVEYQARYNLLFDQFIQAYKQNQPIFAALNQ
jgi:xylulokinase